MKYILAPSILAADFTRLGEEIKAVEANGAEYLHFDVMDGMFVPSISFGMPVLKSIRGAVKCICDVHMMVKDPIRYIDDFVKAGADLITIHTEACEDVGAAIDKIKESGVKAGLSICPDTPISVLDEWLDQIDMVLVMSVNPGFGGQKFIPSALEKIRDLKATLTKRRLTEVDIEVDGGIYLDNVTEVLAAGANIIVAGSAVFGGEPGANTASFMEILNGYQ